MFENIKRFFIPRRVEIQEGKDEKDKIRNQEEKQNKNKTIEEIAVAAGIPYEKAYEEVMELKKLHGISEKQYLRNELWKLEGSDYARKITNIKKKNLERKAYNDKITSCTNLSKKDIRDDIKKLNSKEIYRVTLKSYNKYELYKLKEEEQIAVLKLLAEIASMKKSITEFMEKKDYDSVQKLYSEGYELVKNLMNDTIRDLVSEYFESNVFSEFENERKEQLILDMEATSQLLGYIYHDYIICGFFNKSIPEKCEYLSVNEKNRDINILNPKEQRSLLDDKYRTYQLLKEWYGRDVILLKSADDYDAFADFFKKHRKGVKKPFAGAKGKSIELIEVSEENMRAVFEQYIKKEAFVLEEQIVAHPKMRAIYSGSVNTIRVNTLVDGEEVRYILPHMRFGYGGSFIDNVSSGGYMVSVDIDRGVIDSDAYKSSGECINAHPDTGVVFKGYEIPEVDELRRVTKEIALKMAAEQRLYLVGWDMALTDAGKWVVIEGNGNSGITHAQRLVGHGCKDYYRSTVGPVKERLMKEQNPEEKNY